MNKFLRPGWILPVICVLAIVSLFQITGCREGGRGPGEPTVNLDSARPHCIPLGVAVDYTARFRRVTGDLGKKFPILNDSLQLGRAESFNRDVFQLLLNQKDSNGVKAAGIRIYYGLGADGLVRLVMVPYDTSGRDILKHLASTDEKQTPGGSSVHTESLIVSGAQAMEVGQHCPPVCPPGSPLDSLGN